MSRVTSQTINRASSTLKKMVRKAQKSLFEFETLKSVYEIQQGKFDHFRSAKTLLASLDR